MRVAALYDIHGNLPALEAALADVQASGVNRIVVGGDVVPGPMPRECLDLLLGLDVPTSIIQGNGDRAVLECLTGRDFGHVPERAHEVIRWTAKELGDKGRSILEGWRETVSLDIRGIGEVLFCHATPRSDTEVFTRETPEEALLDVFGDVRANLVVCGHTHMQFDRMVGKTRVVNAGSVGMPYGEPGAYWLFLGQGVESIQTAYSVREASERVLATGYPWAREFAQSILEPRPEDEMLRLFGAARPG